MSVRNCAEIGPILQEVVSRLLANDELCKLLYYLHKKRIKKKEIYEKLIKVVPRVGPKEFDNSVVVVRVARGTKNPNNN